MYLWVHAIPNSRGPSRLTDVYTPPRNIQCPTYSPRTLPPPEYPPRDRVHTTLLFYINLYSQKIRRQHKTQQRKHKYKQSDDHNANAHKKQIYDDIMKVPQLNYTVYLLTFASWPATKMLLFVSVWFHFFWLCESNFTSFLPTWWK